MKEGTARALSTPSKRSRENATKSPRQRTKHDGAPLRRERETFVQLFKHATTKIIICAFDVTCELVMTLSVHMSLSLAGGRDGYIINIIITPLILLNLPHKTRFS